MSNIFSWSDPVLPIPVDCSRQALEAIRVAALEGLLAIPRAGVGTGGLLLGTKEDGRIRILDSVRIPCSHALGPAFVLTDEEIVQARRLIEKTEPWLVVGWYCSKTRAALSLSAADQKLYSSLCPAPWQIALLVKPNAVARSRAAICFRDPDGRFVQGSERELEPLNPDTPEPTAAAATPEPPGIPEPQRIEPKPTAIPAASPIFEELPVPHSGRKWMSWWAAFAICGAFALAFLMKDAIVPRPPLKLDMSDASGHLTIRWNREAVRGIDQGSISLDDGGKLVTIPLDATQLSAGSMGYNRKSERVTALMKAGNARALATFLAPPPHQ
jgi:hypothetical protein